MVKKKEGQDNIKPFQITSGDEARKMGANGGRASAETRRKKADVKKTITEILNNSYTVKDKETGEKRQFTGIEAIMMNLFKMATDPKSRNAVQAIKLILELYEGKQSRAETRLMNAQIALVEAKVKSIKTVDDLEVEDLAPLSRLLNMQTIKEVNPNEENDEH